MLCFLNPGHKQIIQILHVNCQGQVYMRVVGNDDLLSDLFPSYQQRYIYKGNLPFNALYRSREALYAGAMKKRWARNNFLPLMLKIQIFYSLYTSTVMSQRYNSSSGTLKSMVTKQVPLEHILLDWEMNILRTHRSCAGVIVHLLDCPSRIKHLG